MARRCTKHRSTESAAGGNNAVKRHGEHEMCEAAATQLAVLQETFFSYVERARSEIMRKATTQRRFTRPAGPRTRERCVPYGASTGTASPGEGVLRPRPDLWRLVVRAAPRGPKAIAARASPGRGKAFCVSDLEGLRLGRWDRSLFLALSEHRAVGPVTLWTGSSPTHVRGALSRIPTGTPLRVTEFL